MRFANPKTPNFGVVLVILLILSFFINQRVRRSSGSSVGAARIPAESWEVKDRQIGLRFQEAAEQRAFQAEASLFARTLESKLEWEDIVRLAGRLSSQSLEIQVWKWNAADRRSTVEPVSVRIDSSAQFRDQVLRFAADGWRVRHAEFFALGPATHSLADARRSRYRFKLQCEQAGPGIRCTLDGECAFQWPEDGGAGATSGPGHGFTVRLDSAEMRLGAGTEDRFRLIFEHTFAHSTRSFFVDPIIALPSALPGRVGLLLENAGVRVDFPPSGAVVSSISNLGGQPVSAGAMLDGTHLLEATSSGLAVIDLAHPDVRREVWQSPSRLKYPQAIAVGDIDGDGDLDVWLIQYKPPYQGGQFPTPYFDALDGWPSYLLRNDGGGRYTDVTVGSGLVEKRSRRSYSASFIDLDGDGDLDLVNVSDFGGLDLYLNDGYGRFTDITDYLGNNRFMFGMSHAFGNWSRSGRPDLFAAGMDSPAASVLQAIQFDRPGFPGYAEHMPWITYGNRMFLAGRDRLEAAPWGGQVAHSGWSWGVAVADFLNCGEDNIYIANGHETLANSSDYEWQFWLHDIYHANSQNDPRAERYFLEQASTRQKAMLSYGGWQANVLFASIATNHWADVAWLLGVAEVSDCRNVIAEDFDGDGGMDLAVTTFELWPVARQRLLVYRNEIRQRGHWIGFKFESAESSRSLIGAKIQVVTEEGVRTHWFVTGDSYRAQNSFSAHFGLGRSNRVISAELVWPGGQKRVLNPCETDRWNVVSQ